eukprot:1599832-Pleurochrysis_carterae.AAC.3
MGACASLVRSTSTVVPIDESAQGIRTRTSPPVTQIISNEIHDRQGIESTALRPNAAGATVNTVSISPCRIVLFGNFVALSCGY